LSVAASLASIDRGGFAQHQNAQQTSRRTEKIRPRLSRATTPDLLNRKRLGVLFFTARSSTIKRVGIERDVAAAWIDRAAAGEGNTGLHEFWIGPGRTCAWNIKGALMLQSGRMELFGGIGSHWEMRNDLRTLQMVHVAVMLHGDFCKDRGPLKIKGNFWEAIWCKKATFSSLRTIQLFDFIA
jgi:hypothetical protein